MLLNSLRRAQQVTVHSKPEDEEDYDMVMERTQLTVSAWKKGL
jgi:hypothetical protein